MSNHKDNKAKQNLKDLLNKKNQPEESFDAFEQEALEGFTMLENEKEAFDLKEKLDAKIYSEVFTEERASAGRYWYAAAGLLLVIGFSIYLFRSTSDLKKEDLAMESTSGDELQKSMEAQTLKNQDLHYENQQSDSIERKGSTGKAKSDIDSYKSRQAPVAEPAAPSAVKSVFKPAEGASPVEQAKTQAPKPMSIPVRDETSALDVAAVNVEAEQTADKEMARTEEKALRESDSKKEAEALGKHTKKSKAPQNKVETISVDDVSFTSSASSGAVLSSALPEITDEAAFKKELKECLTSKNLNRKFDATLRVDSKGKVEKVVFTNAFSFPKAEQKKIAEIIKELKSLTFKTPSVSGLQQYYLEYRP